MTLGGSRKVPEQACRDSAGRTLITRKFSFSEDVDRDELIVFIDGILLKIARGWLARGRLLHRSVAEIIKG